MSDDAAQLIDQRIAELADWRGAALATLRGWILDAVPGVVEEWKWRNPVWSAGGILCTGESYKDKLKLSFMHGAALPDPQQLFNASLDGNARRAIDVFAGALPGEQAFKALMRAAAAHAQRPKKA